MSDHISAQNNTFLGTINPPQTSNDPFIGVLYTTSVA